MSKAVFVTGIESGNASRVPVLEMAMLEIRSNCTLAEALVKCNYSTHHEMSRLLDDLPTHMLCFEC